MDHPGKADLAAALKRLWVQFLPQIEERIAVLESASAAISAGRLSAQEQQAAQAAAHKLAGSLGTFGLAEGTRLAREAELLYAAEPAQAADRLAGIAALLRALIESHAKGDSQN
jgi:HPt (histidine-containing phosphotransfer) domain-containing protein